MLLRICLIVAVVAGLVALGVSHVKVGGKIVQLTTDLNSTQEALTKTQKEAADAKKDARQSKDALKTVQEDLGVTKKNLDTTTAKAKEQEQLALSKISELETLTKKFNDSERELSRWSALGVTPDQVEKVKKDLATVTADRDAVAERRHRCAPDDILRGGPRRRRRGGGVLPGAVGAPSGERIGA